MHWLDYHATIKNNVWKSFIRTLYINGVFPCKVENSSEYNIVRTYMCLQSNFKLRYRRKDTSFSIIIVFRL